MLDLVGNPVLDLFGNPKGRFSCDVAHVMFIYRDLMHLVCLALERNTQMRVMVEAVCLSCHFKCLYS